mmetsp:Transcript_10248/g.25095  ORF Transcript_10248/g.25095 Transcript_10248/m.25095 type:complete len:210 (+) Transcript_10248:814-1443(+)
MASPGATRWGVILPSLVGPPELHCSRSSHLDVELARGPAMDSLVDGLALTSAASMSPSFLGMNTTGIETPRLLLLLPPVILTHWHTWLLMMITAAAPAFWAFSVLASKLQVPRVMSTILPATAAVLVRALHPLAGTAYATNVAAMACDDTEEKSPLNPLMRACAQCAASSPAMSTDHTLLAPVRCVDDPELADLVAPMARMFLELAGAP